MKRQGTVQRQGTVLGSKTQRQGTVLCLQNKLARQDKTGDGSMSSSMTLQDRGRFYVFQYDPKNQHLPIKLCIPSTNRQSSGLGRKSTTHGRQSAQPSQKSFSSHTSLVL